MISLQALALVVAALFGGPASAPTQAATPATGCQERCYQEKSQAYQRCRTIPPGDRAARLRCFQQADAALRGCLGGCR